MQEEYFTEDQKLRHESKGKEKQNWGDMQEKCNKTDIYCRGKRNGKPSMQNYLRWEIDVKGI